MRIIPPQALGLGGHANLLLEARWPEEPSPLEVPWAEFNPYEMALTMVKWDSEVSDRLVLYQDEIIVQELLKFLSCLCHIADTPIVDRAITFFVIIFHYCSLLLHFPLYVYSWASRALHGPMPFKS